MKPKLNCPQGHPLTEKWLASLWGKWTQWKFRQRVGKDKYSQEKLKNLKVKNDPNRIT